VLTPCDALAHQTKSKIDSSSPAYFAPPRQNPIRRGANQDVARPLANALDPSSGVISRIRRLTSTPLCGAWKILGEPMQIPDVGRYISFFDTARK
jgi:hypothetical protein